VINVTTKIFAHRGASKYAPENTMSAFKLAHEQKADGIELDVQLSKDHVPVIIHDEKLKRTTKEKGVVKEYTVKELKKFDAGSWYSKKYKGEQIPTLREVLEWISPTGLALNIELKNTLEPYIGMEKLVVALVKEYNMQEKVIYSSFNHYSLKEITEINPNAEIAILYDEKLYKPWNYVEFVGATSAHPNFKMLNDGIIAGYKNHRIKVRPYTVNNTAKMAYFIQQDIEAIITDLPDVARSIKIEAKTPEVNIKKKTWRRPNL
jgi:glycerophosphoryl diester phosphodiesterase